MDNPLSNINILLDFLRLDDLPSLPCDQAQITSLQTLSSMCTKEVADTLNTSGGLTLIWNLCGKTKSPEVCQCCLYSLACASESSDAVKETLSSIRVFASVRAILERKDVAERTRLLSTYFLMSLVVGNTCGQELMRSSGCLHVLLKLFISGIDLFIGVPEANSCTRELWCIVTKALQRSLASPRNGANQCLCSHFLPNIVAIIHESKGDLQTVLQACQLFNAVLQGNDECQKRASNCRALEVLVLTLRLVIAKKTFNEVIGELVTALDNLLPEEESHCTRFVKLGGVIALLELLGKHKDQLEAMEVHHINHILTVLCRCAQNTDLGRSQLIERNAAPLIVKLMTALQGDQYFFKVAAKVLLECIQEQPLVTNPQEAEESNSESGSEQKDSEDEQENSLTRNSNSTLRSELDPDARKLKDHFAECSSTAQSCISVILSRQQTQIELLQQLLLQDRHRSRENESKVVSRTWRTEETRDRWADAPPSVPPSDKRLCATLPTQTKDLACQTDTTMDDYRQNDIIDIESCTPIKKTPVKVQCKDSYATACDKYYVRKRSKIRQHILRRPRMVMSPFTAESRIKPRRKAEDEDDTLSLCSEVVDGEIRRLRRMTTHFNASSTPRPGKEKNERDTTQNVSCIPKTTGT